MLNKLMSINENLTPQEICEVAGLDYPIKKQPLSYFNGVSYQEIEDKFAVVANNKVLGICSEYWQPLQNIEIIETAYSAFKESGLKISRIGGFGDSKRIACVANWERKFDVKKVGDLVSAKVLLIGSHEVGVGHSINIYYERLVCTNGMTQQVRVGRKVYGHNENSIKALTHALNSIDVMAMQFKDDVEQLAEIPISYEQAQMLLIKEFGNSKLTVDEQPKVVKQCLELFTGKALGSDLLTAYNTAWGLLNSLTEYYSHYARTQDRLNSIFTGVYGRNISKLQNSLINYSSNYQPVKQLVSVR